jgi:hypothetical protein
MAAADALCHFRYKIHNQLFAATYDCSSVRLFKVQLQDYRFGVVIATEVKHKSLMAVFGVILQEQAVHR